MLTDLDYFWLEYVIQNMRPQDAREIFALRPHDSRMQLAAEAFALISNTGRGKLAWWKGWPVGVAAFTENWKGCWEIWMFGTPDFRYGVFDLVRWFRREANVILSEREGRRLQCDSIADHHEAHKLIRAMGGVEEARFAAYGKGGEEFIRFVWLNGRDNAVLGPKFRRAG